MFTFRWLAFSIVGLISMASFALQSQPSVDKRVAALETSQAALMKRITALETAVKVPAKPADATPAKILAPTNTPLPPSTGDGTVGMDVMVGDVRWKILSAENLGSTAKSSNQFVNDMTTTGMFIKVRFEIENRSKETATFTGMELIDSQERKYTLSSNAIMLIDPNEACVLENLNPNITKVCTHIFEVPKDATALKAYVGDLNMFGGKEAKIDLGL